MHVPMKIVLRDAGLLLVVAAVWAAASRVPAGESLLAAGLSVLAGMLVAVAGFLLHEWGHLAGALASRSAVQFPDTLGYLFLFKFDCGRNSRRQFLSMSMGGFIASGLIVLFLAATLPFQTLAQQVAWVLTVIGVIATFILEVPTAWRVHKGAPLPEGTVYISPPATGGGTA